MEFKIQEKNFTWLKFEGTEFVHLSKCEDGYILGIGEGRMSKNVWIELNEESFSKLREILEV